MGHHLLNITEEPVRTVVLDGLSIRDIALGAAIALLLVLLVIAMGALRDRGRRRSSARAEGGDRNDQPG
jgi:hypothetical protein